MEPDVRDALRELGIDEDTTAEAAHRAYIRRIKQCPPERDPEGFRRARAAYERVRAFLSARTADAEVGGAPVAAGLRAAEPSPAAAVPAPESRLAKAIASAWRIQEPDEWRVVQRAFDLALADGDGGLPMPLLVGVETMGVLVAVNRVPDAIELLATLEKWVGTVGEARSLVGDLAVRWPFMRDLVRVADALNSEWLGPGIARFALRDRFDSVQNILKKVRANDEAKAARAAAALSGSTSVFAERFRAALVDPPDPSLKVAPARPAPAIDGRRKVIGWAVGGALGVLYAAFRTGCDDGRGPTGRSRSRR